MGHSTSDDSSRYRSVDEVNMWKNTDHPISRFRQYILNKGWWSLDEDSALKKKSKKEVLTALSSAEKKKKPSIESMFDDVYDSVRPIWNDSIRNYKITWQSMASTMISPFTQNDVTNYVCQKNTLNYFNYWCLNTQSSHTLPLFKNDKVTKCNKVKRLLSR